MGMCKKCNIVFSALEMKNGYCLTCMSEEDRKEILNKNMIKNNKNNMEEGLDVVKSKFLIYLFSVFTSLFIIFIFSITLSSDAFNISEGIFNISLILIGIASIFLISNKIIKEASYLKSSFILLSSLITLFFMVIFDNIDSTYIGSWSRALFPILLGIVYYLILKNLNFKGFIASFVISIAIMYIFLMISEFGLFELFGLDSYITTNMVYGITIFIGILTTFLISRKIMRDNSYRFVYYLLIFSIVISITIFLYILYLYG